MKGFAAEVEDLIRIVAAARPSGGRQLDFQAAIGAARRAVSATRGVDFASVKPLLTAYTCAKPPSTNSSVPVM